MEQKCVAYGTEVGGLRKRSLLVMTKRNIQLQGALHVPRGQAYPPVKEAGPGIGCTCTPVA